MLKNQQNRRVNFVPPIDSQELFDIGFSEGPTKVAAAQGFASLSAELNLNLRQLNGILSFLKQHTRSLNLPVKKQTDENTKAGAAITSTVSAYIEPDTRDTTIDVCRNGCMVFMGHRVKNKRRWDCSRLIQCLFCRTPRFTACAHSYCKGKPYHMCNKFVPKASRPNKLMRGHMNRTPMETVFYRSSISKLAQLYCLSLTAGNSRLLKYHLDRYKKPGKIMDICDGTEVVFHQQEMSDSFTSYRDKFMVDNPGKVIDECSLCLSFFYDGGINYKRGADSMWPLVTSVVNCNPSDRTKLGVGCSLSLLHNMAGSGVENFLLKLFAKELKALENGIVFVVAGDCVEDDRNVYLQSRLMYMHVDTKALESVTCSKGSGSLICTLCNLNKGFHNPIIDKVAYSGNRYTMHKDHLSRYVGEAKFEALTIEHQVEDLAAKAVWERKKIGVYQKTFIVCSAEEHQIRYYAGDKSVYNRTVLATNAFVLDDRPAGQLDRKSINREIGHGKIQYPSGVTTIAARSAFINSKLWYNKLFPYEKMQRHMRFAFSDTREQVFWRHVDNEEYCRDGALGQQAMDKYEEKLQEGIANGTRVRPKTKHDASHNGRHAVCPLMSVGLKSFGFLNCNFDEMHRGANALRYFVGSMKGDRAVADTHRKFSAATGKHPSLKYKKRLAEFQLLDREEKVADAVVNSMLISPLYKADFQLKYPFQQTGHLKSHGCFVMLMVYLPYVLSFTDLHENYQEFYARYAYDMHCYLNPCLDAETLRDEIIPSVYETRMCQEGLFPDSESVYIFHEIIDIIHQIEKYGHIRSLTCFFGERAMGLMKSFVSRGGVHYLKTLYHRYVVKENSIAALKTNNELYFTNHPVPRYSDFVLKLLGKARVVEWHVDDKDRFFEALMDFVQSQVIDSIHEKSPFFRLYRAFQDNLAEQDEPRKFSGFTSWIGGINEIYLSGDILNTELTSKFVNNILLDRFAFDLTEISNGFIYMVDFLGVKDSILNFNPKVHEKLITKGILFNCRGHDYGALTGVMEGDRRLLRFGGNLQTCWHLRNQYASFVRITDSEAVAVQRGHLAASRQTGKVEFANKKVPGPNNGPDRFKRTAAHLSDEDSNSDGFSDIDEPTDTVRINRAVKFGQINSCWRTDMPGDVVVHGLAFANVTVLKALYSAKRRHFYIPAASMPFKMDAQKFVSVNYIDSTSIGVSPVSTLPISHIEKKTLKQSKNRAIQTDEDVVPRMIHRPMLKPEGTQSFIQYTDASIQSSGAYAKQDALLSELYMIELHPERISYNYECIFPDLDGTKLWEKNHDM
jgi:hypothetical protein